MINILIYLKKMLICRLKFLNNGHPLNVTKQTLEYKMTHLYFKRSIFGFSYNKEKREFRDSY